MIEYRYDKATLSYIRYHIVFCPRYRRKIFDIPGVRERFTEIVKDLCADKDIDILELECGSDYVYISVRVLPNISAAGMVSTIKAATNVMRSEFEKIKSMPNLWTRAYFVSTEDELKKEIISEYVEIQKKHP